MDVGSTQLRLLLRMRPAGYRLLLQNPQTQRRSPNFGGAYCFLKRETRPSLRDSIKPTSAAFLTSLKK